MPLGGRPKTGHETSPGAPARELVPGGAPDVSQEDRARSTSEPPSPPVPPPDRRRWARPRYLVTILTIVGLALVVTRLHSAEHDVATAWRHFSWSRLPWLIGAFSAEVLSFYCYALVQRRLLRAGGAHLRRRTMSALALAATGVTNVVPGGSAPASGWLVSQYRRRGVPMPLALWAVLAGGFAATVSVLFLLALGALIAGLLPVWAFAVCLLALAGGGIAVVAASHHLAEVTRWLERHHSRRGVELVRELSHRAAGVMRFRVTVRGGAAVLGLSLANWAMDVFVLISAFGLLGLPVPWRAVLFAYAVAQVAGSLAPLPGGIGFVEGGMIGGFALAGASIGNAVVATIVYRVITCWAVAAAGSLMIVIMSRRTSRAADIHGVPATQAVGASATEAVGASATQADGAPEALRTRPGGGADRHEP